MTRGARVIAISEHIARHIRDVYGIDPARLRVIPRGVDVELFDPAAVAPERVERLRRVWGLNGAGRVLMLPGRLTRWKGQGVFLDALSRLERRGYKAILLGSEQARRRYRMELTGMIWQQRLDRRVQIVDHCDDMPAAYLAADVVVSASTDPEAFGRIAVEAQAMGRPVIASDHGGSRETVLPGVTGWLTPPGDAEALAAALDEALSAPAETLHAMGAEAAERVRRDFTTEAMCRRTLAVYEEVLAESRRT